MATTYETLVAWDVERSSILSGPFTREASLRLEELDELTAAFWERPDVSSSEDAAS